MRRPRPEVPLLALLLAAVTACGAGGAPADPAAPTAGATDAFPVTIEHSLGSTTIPSEPLRVVTLGYTDQDPVLALGVVPVMTAEWYGEQPGALFPWAAERLGGRALPTVLATADTIAFEQVAAMDPDVILSLYGGLERDDYETLSRIAPTVTQPAGIEDYSIPWDVQTEVVGRVLGRSAQAAELVDDVRTQITATRDAHPEYAGLTAMTAGWFSDQWYVYAGRDQRGRLLTDLGFTLPPEIDELAGENFGSYVSFERADLLDVDALVWVLFSPGEAEAIRASPGYAAGPVATGGRAIFVDSTAGSDLDAMGGFITVLSLPRLLEALPAQLTAAVDGDPATVPA